MLCSFKSCLKIHLCCDVVNCQRLSSWCAVIVTYDGNCLHEAVGVKNQKHPSAAHSPALWKQWRAVAVLGGTRCFFLTSSALWDNPARVNELVLNRRLLAW